MRRIFQSLEARVQKRRKSPGVRSLEASRRWRADYGDDFAFVPSVNSEVLSIHSENAQARIKLTQANQTEIGQVRISIGVASSQSLELRPMFPAIEGYLD
jgi:hypothetical protein